MVLKNLDFHFNFWAAICVLIDFNFGDIKIVINLLIKWTLERHDHMHACVWSIWICQGPLANLLIISTARIHSSNKAMLLLSRFACIWPHYCGMLSISSLFVLVNRFHVGYKWVLTNMIMPHGKIWGEIIMLCRNREPSMVSWVMKDFANLIFLLLFVLRYWKWVILVIRHLFVLLGRNSITTTLNIQQFNAVYTIHHQSTLVVLSSSGN